MGCLNKTRSHICINVSTSKVSYIICVITWIKRQITAKNWNFRYNLYLAYIFLKTGIEGYSNLRMSDAKRDPFISTGGGGRVLTGLIYSQYISKFYFNKQIYFSVLKKCFRPFFFEFNTNIYILLIS